MHFLWKLGVFGGISLHTVSVIAHNIGEILRLRATKQQVSVTFWPNLNDTYKINSRNIRAANHSLILELSNGQGATER